MVPFQCDEVVVLYNQEFIVMDNGTTFLEHGINAIFSHCFCLINIKGACLLRYTRFCLIC